MKRTIALIITVLIFIAASPLCAFAADDGSRADICKAIAQGLNERSEAIDLSQWEIPADGVGGYFGIAGYLAPAAFDLGWSYGYTTVNGNAGRIIKTIRPRYTMTDEDYAAARTTYDGMIADITALVPKGLDEYETALFLHDYICATFRYSQPVVNSQPVEYPFDSYNAYGILTNGNGVCEAYTKLYIALLAECGIQSFPVVSDNINHAWNEVLLGKCWYHVDVTWGDPVIPLGTYAWGEYAGRASHNNFLYSSAAFRSSHDNEFDAVFEADDASLDEAEWHGYDLPFAFAETPSDAGVFCDAYAVASNGVIRRYDISAGTNEDIYTINARWPAASANSFWQGCFSGVAAYGAKLIYNDADSFYSYDPASGSTEQIYTPEKDKDLNIYGCYNFGDTLYYVTGPKSNAGDFENRTLHSVKFSEIFLPQVPEYTVKFVDWDGTVISETVYKEGESVTVPEDPADWSDETYNYTFTGWSPQISAAAEGDATYTAQYGSSYIEYTVSFLDWDMTVIEELTLHYGDDIAVPGDPQRGPDETYTYTFTGWDKQPTEKCEGSATYTAVYSETYIDYTVKFLDWDGSVISEKNYHYGDTLEIPDDPQRAPDGEQEYVFSGWDKEPSATCAGSAEYTATYVFADDVYIIIFADYDGTVIATRLCTEGEIPQAPGSVLREADETYTYAFAGWDVDIVPACGDATYTAVYQETYIEYTVKFIADGTVISEKAYHYGDEVAIPEMPLHPESDSAVYIYTFTGWNVSPSETCVGDAEYHAAYSAEYIEYTVKFLDWDGSVISEKAYHYGDRVQIPADPARPDGDDLIYTFTGWDKEVTMCEGDATYTAVYSSEEKPQQPQYMRGDVNGNGKIDAADYAMCKRAFLKTFTLSAEQLLRADINGNGKVDASEYAMIKRHFLGTYRIPQPGEAA